MGNIKVLMNVDNVEKAPMFVQDIMSIVDELGIPDAAVVNIDPYKWDNDAASVKMAVDKLIDMGMGEKLVIIANAYASTIVYPESEYYYEDGGQVLSEMEKAGKKLLQIYDILEKQGRVLVDAGFININKYCGLATQEPFVFPDTPYGKAVLRKLEEYNSRL
ncbi:MAG: hypothetical protein NC489_45590 [Ruminococcus flavefaciens]|nr:hypothetical protein [Ruminococcus flavefaciens]